MIQAELFLRFVLISLIAFGGGQAALPLVERVAVQDTGWLTPATFGAAVAFSYLTPGPVLIIATFVGQQVAGLSGALAATIGAFLVSWALAAAAAQQIKRLAQDWRLRAFGAGASPAVIGILGVTVLSIGREALASWPYVGIGAAAFAIAAWTRIHPVVLLVAGGIAGWLIGA
jgi:chromate transporter